MPLAIAIVLAVAITALVGLIVEKLAIEPAGDAEVVTLIIITIGASLTLRGLVQVFLGKGNARAALVLRRNADRRAGCDVAAAEPWVVGVTWSWSRRWPGSSADTILGKAGAGDGLQQAGGAIGRRQHAIHPAVVFGLAAALGALGGILVAPITYTSYDAGIMLGLKGFVAATLGGLGSGVGAIAGGLLLGAWKHDRGYISSAYKDAMPFVLILLILFFRPQGLFGRRPRTV